jgi:hypothetical protein
VGVEVADGVSPGGGLNAGCEAHDHARGDSRKTKQQRRRTGEVLAVARVSTEQKVHEGAGSRLRHVGCVPEAATTEQVLLDLHDDIPLAACAGGESLGERDHTRVNYRRPRHPRPKPHSERSEHHPEQS